MAVFTFAVFSAEPFGPFVRVCEDSSYSIFGMGVDRKHNAKWLFSQWGPHGQVFVRGVEVKATFHCPQKVYVYSENALNPCLAPHKVRYTHLCTASNPCRHSILVTHRKIA
jgi:hypothetical protein